jgi:hypothetical protein
MSVLVSSDFYVEEDGEKNFFLVRKKTDGEGNGKGVCCRCKREERYLLKGERHGDAITKNYRNTVYI